MRNEIWFGWPTDIILLFNREDLRAEMDLCDYKAEIDLWESCGISFIAFIFVLKSNALFLFEIGYSSFSESRSSSLVFILSTGLSSAKSSKSSKF